MSSLPTTSSPQVPALPRPEIAPARAGHTPAATSFSFRQIVSAMLRHIWLLLTIFILIQIAAWASFVACYMFDKQYTARGQMSLPQQAAIGDFGPTRAMDQNYIAVQTAEQAMRISSEQILDLVLKQPEAQKSQWYVNHQGDGKPLVELLADAVTCAPVPKTTLIELRVVDRNPKAAAEICNQIMQFYQRFATSERTSKLNADKRTVEDEIAAKTSQRKTLEDRIEDARGDKGFADLDRTRAELFERVSQLMSGSTTQELHLAASKRQLDSTEAQFGPSAPPMTAQDERMRILLAEAQRNPTLTNLTARRQSLIEERSRLEVNLLPNHPEIKSINQRIEEVEGFIRTTQADLIAAYRQQMVRQAEGTYQSAKELLDTMTQKLEAAKADKRILEDKWAKYKNLIDDKARIESEIQRRETQLAEIKVQMNRQLPQMEISRSAAAPRSDEISFPRWEIFLAGGLVLGLGLAVGLVFLVEVIDSSVRTPRDISDQLRLPLLGFVPMVGDGQAPRETVCRLAVRDPMSLAAESFRQIRTNLLFAAPADQLHSLAVTSAASDEGKTVVAVNLAATIALSGRRVLLVDANFRRPMLGGVFNLSASSGLSNVLTKQTALAEAVQPSDVPNMAILPTGPTPPNPAELLGSATMRSFLDEVDADYDVVIFDTAPALLVSDAMTLATMVDGVVLVARGSVTSRGILGRLRDQLHRVNARIVGAVLNAARQTRGGYFRKTQQQYEEYNRLPE